MGALSAGRVTKEYAPLTVERSYPMDALAQIWEGGIVALDSTGYAVPGATSTTQIAVGVAQESKLAGSVDGDTNISVHVGTFYLAVDSTFAQTAVGGLCYIVNDQTVSLTSTNRSIAGVVQAVDSGGAWVQIGLVQPNEDAQLSSFEASLAATTNGAGASLVGIEDPGSLITGATVEAALVEIVKKADAALGVPVIIQPNLTSCVTGSILYTMIPGYSGTIRKLDASSIVVPTAAGSSVTLTAAINGTAVSNGTLNLTYTNLLTLGNRVSGAQVSGLNSFVPTDTITIIVAATANTAFTAGEASVQLFLASA